MARKNNSLVEEINQAEYLQEICKETPQITIGTQCGVGMYEFKSIGYRDNELILEFKLVMDNKRSDCDRISYNLGNINYLNGDSESALKNYKKSLIKSRTCDTLIGIIG